MNDKLLKNENESTDAKTEELDTSKNLNLNKPITVESQEQWDSLLLKSKQENKPVLLHCNVLINMLSVLLLLQFVFTK